MTCEHAHGLVVADGRCGGCGTVLTASGPLDVDQGGGLRFLAPPFVSEVDARCRAGGDHLPGVVSGVCVACSTRLDGFTDPATAGVRWFESPY